MTGPMLAKAAGARTILTWSSDKKLLLAREKHGVDFRIDYKAITNWATEANKIAAGRGVDFIFENGGSGTLGQSMEYIARGGQIGLIGFLEVAEQKDMPDAAMGVLVKGCMVRGINVGAEQLTEDLVAFVTSKNLGIPIETRSSVRGKRFWRLIERRRGRVVLERLPFKLCCSEN